MDKKLELLMDIQKLIDAIDDEVDSYIGTFMANSQIKREIMRKIYWEKRRELTNLAKETTRKWKTG